MERKKRDFTILIVLQVLAYLVASVLGEAKTILTIPAPLVLVLMMSVLIPFNYFLFRVTANYIEKKSFKMFYGLLLVTQFGISGFVNREVPISETIGLATIGYLMHLSSMSIIFYVIIKDMFANKHDNTYSLLAATCAYLLIPVIFGYLYSVISLYDPQLLGVGITTTQGIIRGAFQASHYIAAGLGASDKIGELIKHVAVIEAFIVNLYIVFVVGRLLASYQADK